MMFRKMVMFVYFSFSSCETAILIAVTSLYAILTVLPFGYPKFYQIFIKKPLFSIRLTFSL